MELPPRWAVLLFLLLSSTKASRSAVDKEEFQEELLLKPLPDRKVLAHFHFESRAPRNSNGRRHLHLFPKAISQMVEKFRVKEMELSFTQGRWNYERWGGFDTMSSNNAKPPGVELWAVFDVPKEQVDASWKNLTHTLSGLFCASINFLESSTMYSAPDWSFRQASGHLRYGMLPREAVCTENLTPWLKLLPCRDNAGLSALMDRPSIYTSFYHSQRLHLTSNASDLEGLNPGIVLEQTLTVVLHPRSQRTILTHISESYLQPSWSLSSIFGRKVNGRCALAKSSKVYLQLERGLVSELKKNIGSEGYDGEANFELSVNPDRVLKEENSRHGIGSSLLYEFSVDKYSNSKPFDLGLTWKFPVIWSCQQAPLHAIRFLMGSGNERGAIAILLKSTDLNDSSPGADRSSDGCELHVNIFQIVPWYIRVYYHSLQLFVDDQLKAVGAFVEKIHVMPSKDKISPGMMEMVLKLPCGVKSAALTLDFDKGFLHIDEYPPDANQGFDIPSAAISFPNFHASMHFPSNDSERKSPMLSKFQESSPVLSYTEVLLVPLTTPDFSMPYNVITITCTVFALYFGSLLNVLRQRVGEKERLLKSKATAVKTGRPSELLSRLSAKLRGRSQEPSQSPSESSPLINSKLVLKVLLMAALAVAWQYYFG
ncbi:PREDICTED: GPI transamidase component PIG-T-like [Populus euphratica]|uniref:GPI transamidase component PIG-T-like n=1 Tax=Populus euphratica TaxID=75702 RepID=A0AAJ6TH98_POPEU|nr:PREDICTED: GPI transamidase component PIG-T-like [Populus euphratica]